MMTTNNYLVGDMFQKEGIFANMNYDFDYLDKEHLDKLFVLKYAERSLAPIASRLVENGELSHESLKLLGELIVPTFQNKWDRMKDVLNAKYDLVYNYHDELHESVENTTTDKGSATDDNKTILSGVQSTENTRTDDLTNTNSSTANTQTTDNGASDVYGFNSENGVHSGSTNSSNVEDSTSSTQDKHTGTQKNAGTVTDDKTTTVSNSSTHDKTIENKVVRESTHSGNIGNLTSQQMLQQEIDLWKWNYLESVLTDIKNYLTLSVYC